MLQQSVVAEPPLVKLAVVQIVHLVEPRNRAVEEDKVSLVAGELLAEQLAVHGFPLDSFDTVHGIVAEEPHETKSGMTTRSLLFVVAGDAADPPRITETEFKLVDERQEYIKDKLSDVCALLVIGKIAARKELLKFG